MQDDKEGRKPRTKQPNTEKIFFKPFSSQYVAGKKMLFILKGLFPCYSSSTSMKKTKRSLKAFYLPLPLCSKRTNLKQKISENNYNGEQSSL